MSKKIKEKIKVLVIHHDKDADGIVSAAIAVKYLSELRDNILGDKLHFEAFGYNYGKDEELDVWLKPEVYMSFDYIQFIDVTPPVEWLRSFGEQGHHEKVKLQIFDHHAPVQKEIMELMSETNKDIVSYYLFSDEWCGAMLYFMGTVTNGWQAPLLEDCLQIKPGLFASKKKIMNKMLDDFSVKTFGRFPFSSEFYGFLKTISFYDTWRWYSLDNDVEKSRIFNFQTGFKSAFLDVLDTSYTPDNNVDAVVGQVLGAFFNVTDDALRGNMAKLTKDGSRVNAVTSNIALNKKFEFINYEGNMIAVCSGDVDFHVSERIKRDYSVCAGVLYYKLDFADRKARLSWRGLYGVVDGSKMIKSITNGNGGGHLNAAGGATEIPVFLEFIYKNIVNETK